MKKIRIGKNAQEAREILLNNGWIPLVKIEHAEHWIKRDYHGILYWLGEFPSKTIVLGVTYLDEFTSEKSQAVRDSVRKLVC